MEESTTIDQLRCEYLSNPLGITERQPRLSWIIESERRGARQTAYRIRVASDRQSLVAGPVDLWDSGRVESDRSNQIVYQGQPLPSRARCYWQTTAWDELDNVVTSPTAFWTMGLLERGDWQAHWITHAPEIVRRDADALTATVHQPGTVPLFRKPFVAAPTLRRATLYVTARGVVEVRINGRCITPDQLIPEWSDYHRRLHFRTFDITTLLTTGDNVVAAMLGDGWWSGYVGWQENARPLWNSGKQSAIAT